MSRMKFILATLALSLTIPFYMSGAMGADSFSLTLVSENRNSYTFSYPQQDGFGYLYFTKASETSEWVIVSRTYDPSRTTVRFDKGSYSYKVSAIVEGGTGSYTNAAPPPPPQDTTAPSSPSNLSASSTSISYNLSWSASTDNIGVTGYDVFRNGVNVGSTSSLSFNNTSLTCGTSYVAGVRAKDAAGNVSTTSTLNVQTSVCSPPSDTTAPTVSLTSPTNDSTVSGSVNVSANASDNVGVTKVEFYRDGTLFNTDTSSPYSTSVDTTSLPNGSYTFGAKAYDSANNVGTASNVSVTVSNTTPSPTGYPDASNTGVPNGVSLTTYTGPSNITTPNTVIDGKTIGCISISTTGVVIRNSRIVGSCGYAVVNIDDRTSNQMMVTIEDSEISCNNSGGNNAIGESDFTLRRVEITKCENGGDINQNVLIEDSYIHDLTIGGHEDGFQLAAAHWNGSAFVCCALNVTFRHNTIYGMGNGDTSFGTSAIIGGLTGNTNIIIENNLLGGGAYTVYCVGDGPGINFRLTDNHFTTRFKSTVGAFGPSDGCSDEILSGNVYHETGQPINLS